MAKPVSSSNNNTWAEVLCCNQCSELFSIRNPPVNLLCNIICKNCLHQFVEGSESSVVCDCYLTSPAHKQNALTYPINHVLLKIFRDPEADLTVKLNESEEFGKERNRVDEVLVEMALQLKKIECEKGGAIWSETLSTQIQKKVIRLISCQLMEQEGRFNLLRHIKGLVERIIMEFSTKLQNSHTISNQLWTSVRQRGCQFLGPSMQDDILKLVCLALEKGAEISRKNLVMYVVQMLSADYPQISKTSVGHVVQLLYRASCFTVIKRDGESSLMRLKEEFRNYPGLRAEHDTQVVQIALEAKIRISPDQWSSLLYGDQDHKSHIQSIIDRLLSPMSFSDAVNELIDLNSKNDDLLNLKGLLPFFDIIKEINITNKEQCAWPKLVQFIQAGGEILKGYSQFKKLQKEKLLTRKNSDSSQRGNGSKSFYKTRLCREVFNGFPCSKGEKCTFAHSQNELRNGNNSMIKDPVTKFIGNNYQPNSNDNQIMGGQRRFTIPQIPAPLVINQQQGIQMMPYYAQQQMPPGDRCLPPSPFPFVPQSPNMMMEIQRPGPSFYFPSQPPTPVPNHPPNTPAFFDGVSGSISYVSTPVFQHYYPPITPTFARQYESNPFDEGMRKEDKPKPHPLNLHGRKDKNGKRMYQTNDAFKKMSIAEEEEQQHHVSRLVAESLFRDNSDIHEQQQSQYYEYNPNSNGMGVNYANLPGTPLQSPMNIGMYNNMGGIITYPDRFHYPNPQYSMPKTPTSKRLAYIWETSK
uniref:RING-type E3 ubiquitin transferase n=1 Tax=Rhabditophanes sp. KR3021 TaxID=114890 RepID=A0AC35TIQ0_9BILA